MNGGMLGPITSKQQLFGRWSDIFLAWEIAIAAILWFIQTHVKFFISTMSVLWILAKIYLSLNMFRLE